MSTQHTVNVEKNADTLLDTIGRLFARNQSLQKGLATLTRRVQELEAELAAEKERGITLMTPRGMETYNSKGVLQVVMGAVEETKTPTAADSQLQADIDALKTRVANLEFALHPESSRRQAVSVSETCLADAFRQAVADVVKQEIEKECRIGGAINRAIR